MKCSALNHLIAQNADIFDLGLDLIAGLVVSLRWHQQFALFRRPPMAA